LHEKQAGQQQQQARGTAVKRMAGAPAERIHAQRGGVMAARCAGSSRKRAQQACAGTCAAARRDSDMRWVRLPAALGVGLWGWGWGEKGRGGAVRWGSRQEAEICGSQRRQGVVW